MSTDDELAGSHVLLTGVTGFLGQATLERLLSSYPDTRVSVLIRLRGGRCAADRLTALLRKLSTGLQGRLARGPQPASPLLGRDS